MLASEPMLTLYDYPISGNGWKVRTLLRQLGRPFTIRWVDILRGEQHEAWFVAKNPVAQIPVLEDDEGIVWTESNAILETFAQGSPLLPEGHCRHQIRSWLNFEQTWIDGVISRARFRRLFPEVIATPPEFFAAWAVEGERALRTLDTHLGSQRYMVLDRFTVADIGIFAYAHVAYEAGFHMADFPALQRWIQRVAQEPAVLPLDSNPEALPAQCP